MGYNPVFMKAAFRRTYAISLMISAVGAYAQSPKQLLTILTPVTMKESADPDTMEIDASKADLELRLWQVRDTYNFESQIDVREANQAILPTDEHGRLIKDKNALSERPYIRYYAPNREPVTIDINCDRKRCRAVWAKAPFDPKKPQSFKLEVNIRGLKGRHWQAGYNQLVTSQDTVHEFPRDKHMPARTSLFNLESFWPTQEFGQFPRSAAVNEFIETWTIPAGEKFNTGFRKFRKLTRYALLEGDVDVEIASGEYLERRRFLKGTTLWFMPGQVVSLQNAGPPYQAVRLLRLEFTNATP